MDKPDRGADIVYVHFELRWQIRGQLTVMAGPPPGLPTLPGAK